MQRGILSMSIKERVFKKESLDRYLSEDRKFNKTLSAKDLISMGIGAVIAFGKWIPKPANRELK